MLNIFNNLSQLIAIKFQIDKIVFLGILGKVWTILAGPLTAIFITNYFTTSIQGYYYTFATLLSLQMFIELGLGNVIQLFSSHEWAKLELSETKKIIGDSNSFSRLVSIFNISFKWFLKGSVLISSILIIGGYFFFNTSKNYNVNWLYPWLSLSFLTGVNFLLSPFWSILEGCNQIKNLYTFRLVQIILINITTWLAIIFGAELWTASIVSIVSIFCSLFFLRIKYYNFFKQIVMYKYSYSVISWKKDMLPLQWRFAISWASGYLSFSLFTPILFKYHGPDVAGKFGLTWGIVIALTSLSSAWMNPRVPKFAILASQNKILQLNNLAFNTLKITTIVHIIISFLFLIFISIIPHFNFSLLNKFIDRVLPMTSLIVLLLGQLLVVITLPFSSYMRAFKEEPLYKLSILSGLAIALLLLILGKKFGALGASISFFTVNLICAPLVFIIWNKFKNKKIVNR